MFGKILVCDDEKDIGEIIAFNLKKEGYEVELAFDGNECVKKNEKDKFDLIILDVMMPVMDGFSALKEIRKTSSVPVIMLTAREEEVDKILGLELGADDYIVKPFSIRELSARIKAVLRRFKDDDKEKETKEEVIKTMDLIIDLNKYEIKKNDEIIELTLREYELLKFLASNPGKVFSREELLPEVWDYEYFGDIRTVDVTVRRLREKIEDEGDNYKYIITKRGVGYYFGG